MRSRAETKAAPFPDAIEPMLASAGTYPANPDAFAFELKWDGFRTIAYLDRGKLTLRSRRLLNVTAQYPELADMPAAFPGRRLVLDGEIVAPDETGRPSFQRMQNRLGPVEHGRMPKRGEGSPVVFVVFDVLHLDGQDTMRLPYEERRAILDSLPLRGDAWRLSPTSFGEGEHLLEMKGWEGIVAKRIDSTYVPGARSKAWIKIKVQKRQELVIGGWNEGQGSRGGTIGALLMGYYEGDKLHYAGSVGTGFTDATLDMLKRQLSRHPRKTSPFDGPVDKKNANFVEPKLVAEIEFTEWTSDGRLRHPSFKGLRTDKLAKDVVREET